MNNTHKIKKNTMGRIILFYRQNLSQIVFLSLLGWFFVFVRQLPYFNVIPQYHFYVVGIYIILIVLLFRKRLSSKLLFLAIEVMIVFALLLEVLLINDLAEFLAFAIFNLIVVVAFTEFLSNRKNLKVFDSKL